MSLPKTETAAKFCAVMLDRNRTSPRQTINTTSLLAACGIDRGQRQYALKIMHALCRANVCGKIGVGKFRWFLINQEFNKFNPFLSKPVHKDDAVQFTVRGRTYDHKESLKSFGCFWSSEDSCWKGQGLDTMEQVKRISSDLEVSVVDGMAPPVAPPTTTTTQEPTNNIPQAVLDALVNANRQALENLKLVATRVDLLEKEIERSAKNLIITTPKGTQVTLNDVVLPDCFNDVLDLAKMRQNIMLVGPAGCGKTHLAEMVAKSLDLSFGSASCTAGMTEIQLLGRSVPDLTTGKSRFEGTEFLRCYEEGGVFLLDEMDAIDANVLLVLNTALANKYINVPNRPNQPRANQHPDFVCIAAVNTYGRGADRQYVGRAQLDAASLDRFVIGTVEMDYSEIIEKHLCPDDELRNAIIAIRQNVVNAGLRRIVSTRFMQKAYEMKAGCGWTTEKCLFTLIKGWSPEEISKLNGAHRIAS